MLQTGIGRLFGDDVGEFLLGLVPTAVIEASKSYFGAGPVLTAALFFLTVVVGAILLLTLFERIKGKRNRK